MKKPKNYSASDIERYHNNEMTPAERNMMEKAALEDPFLADAMEGFTLVTSPQADVDRLQNRLKDRLAKKKKRPIFYMNNNWLRVAALFIVMAAGWFIIGRQPNNANDLAINKADVQQAAENKPVTNNSTAADTTSTISSLPIATDAASTDNTSSNLSSNAQRRIVAAPVQQQSMESVIENATANNNAADLSADKKMAEVAAAPANDNVIASRKEAKDSTQHIDVVMQKSDESLQEVVVTGYGRKYANAASKSRADSLEPVDGWADFNYYISENIQAPSKLRAEEKNRFVELRFSVNVDGDPVNITVSKSLCEPCDKEAIRLLREGPKWKTTTKQGIVKIKF